MRPSPIAAYGQVADRIYREGDVVTVNDAQSFAKAVAIKDGKILAVGSDEEIAKFKDAKTEIIDLAGRALLPGFIDGHGTCFGTGIQAASANLLAPPGNAFRADLPPRRESRTPIGIEGPRFQLSRVWFAEVDVEHRAESAKRHNAHIRDNCC